MATNESTKPQFHHPFISDDLEMTWIHTDSVMAMLEEYQHGLIANHEELTPDGSLHHSGALYVLQGVRQAVSHMRDLALGDKKVTKLEGNK